MLEVYSIFWHPDGRIFVKAEAIVDGKHIDVQAFIGDKLIDMQSTGLFDKNGAEIFEGDGVTYRVDSYIVAKKDAAIGLALLKNKEITSFKPLVDDLVDFDKLEVVGSIHEHPHLVEGRDGMD